MDVEGEDDDVDLLFLFFQYTSLSYRTEELMFRFPTQLGINGGFYYKDDDEYVPGSKYITSCLRCPNPQRMKENIGVFPHTFEYIFCSLEPHLKGFRNTDVSHQEMVGIFLHILICGGGYRSAGTLFQRSKSTIHNSFHVIAKMFFFHLYDCHISWPQADSPRHDILNDNRYSPFGNCVGGGDGTYIKVIVPASLSSRMRCRKGYTCQNIFAVADFDSKFLFVQAGGDGAEHDSRILTYIEQKNMWPLKENQTILLDAAYCNSSQKLTPYRGVRYHLKEWRHASNRPNNSSELYNLRHSTLRSRAIECAFGVLKEKFRILQQPLEFKNTKAQMLVIYDIFCLHNIILIHEGMTRTLPDYENIDADNWIDDMDLTTINGATIRDAISGEMWLNYLLYLQS